MNIEIIAELAQGFEGRPEQALLLLKAAAAAGADAAKYQLVYADELATPDYKYYDLFKSLEMDDDTWESLAAKALGLGIQMHLDIFGTRSLQLAERIGVAAVKLHGTDITNVGLLEDVARSNLSRVLLGAGGAYSSEINQALRILNAKQVVVILGFQGYPTPNEANQIDRVRLLFDWFGSEYPTVSIGFADHASPEGPLRYSLAATAIGAGARVIEKHLTLGRGMRLEDHESALNPDEFSEFSRVIHDCMQAIGKSIKVEDFNMSEAEKEYRNMIRRHVVAKRNLSEGSKIRPEDIVLKRTSSDHAINDPSLVYQQTVKQDLFENNPISHMDFE